MKKSELKPGTRIMACLPREEWSDEKIVKYYHDEWDEHVLLGVIIDKPARTGKIWVAWDESDHTDDGEEQEINIDILTLESERSALATEFSAYSKEILHKMKEAAKLVNEAGKLSKKAHASSLKSMFEATRPLVSAMDSNGWRSSSWGC